MSQIILDKRLRVAEAMLQAAFERITALEEIILEPFDEQLDKAVLARLPDGKAIAMYQGFGSNQGWNAYVPLAKEVMTKEMALDLASEHNND